MERLWRKDRKQWYYIKKSIYFYDEELFAQEVCIRWVTDDKTGEQFDTPEFHKEMWASEAEGEDALYVVPRGFAKTTSICKIKVLHSMVYQYEPSTLIISSEKLGEETVGDVRVELEGNKYLHKLFGNLVPGQDKINVVNRKWRQKHLQLSNGHEVETISKGESLRGKRPTKIYIDDPQEDKDVKNPRIALEYAHWVWTSVYNMLMDGGSMTVLGTIISNNCFVNMLKQEAVARSFKLVEYPAIIDFNLENWTGTPLWKKRWSMDKLKRRYRKIGHDPFMQEFMHKPMIKNGTPVFSPEFKYKIVKPIKVVGDIKYFKKLTKFVRDEKGKLVRNEKGKLKKEPIYDGFAGLDFGMGNISGDPSTIVIRNAKGELLLQWRGWLAQDLIAFMLDEIVPLFKSIKIVPENNSSLAFLTEARKHLQWYNLIYRVETFDDITKKQSTKLGWNTNVKTKPLMINTLKQYMREGNYELSEEMHEEVLHYYYDEKGGMNAISPYHDDLIIGDSLSLQAIGSGITSPFLSFI